MSIIARYLVLLASLSLPARAGDSPIDVLCRALLAATKGDVRKALEYVDKQILLRLGQVKVDFNTESHETLLKAAELADYLRSEGSDPLEKRLLEAARKSATIVEVSGSGSQRTGFVP